MDFLGQLNQTGIIAAIRTLITGLIGRIAWTRAQRASAAAAITHTNAESAKTSAETRKIAAEAAKVQAEATHAEAETLKRQIAGRQAGFDFMYARMNWAEAQLDELQQQVQNGWDHMKKLEDGIRTWQATAMAWQAYAIALERAHRVAPATIQKQIAERLKQLRVERPEVIA